MGSSNMKVVQKVTIISLVAGIFGGKKLPGVCPQVTDSSNFDVENYMCRWYQIAHLPFRDFNGKYKGVCTTADYALVDSTESNYGTYVSVINQCDRADQHEVAEGYALEDSQGVLSVDFGPEPVSGKSNYIVLKTDNNYSSYVWSCKDTCDEDSVCSNSPYIWILNRSPDHPSIETEDMINEMMRIILADNPEYPIDQLKKYIVIDDNQNCFY